MGGGERQKGRIEIREGNGKGNPTTNNNDTPIKANESGGDTVEQAAFVGGDDLVKVAQAGRVAMRPHHVVVDDRHVLGVQRLRQEGQHLRLVV